MVRLWVILMVALVVALSPGSGWDEGPARSRSGLVQDGVRFEAIDVFVDSGAQGLGAWQVEVRAAAGDVKLVGVEGGVGVYAQPPYYDPAALHDGQMNERVVIAGLSTAAGLPSGRARVARLHMQAKGAAKYEVRLETAAGPDGRKIEARADWSPAVGGAGDRR